MKVIYSIIILVFLSFGCNQYQQQFFSLQCPPGAMTDHTVTLIWNIENIIQEGYEYSIIQNGTIIGTTKQSFYKVKDLAPDSLYEFELTLKNDKGRIAGRSNLIRVRTKPEETIYNILDFGAVGDGKTLNTVAIQKTIDSCKKNGMVLIPKGEYITGALFVKSNMSLLLEEGAILRGSANLADYPVVRSRYEGIEGDQYASLINGGALCGEGIQNFSIRGKGIMYGEGEALYKLEKKKGAIKRGRIVCLMNGEDIYLEGVRFFESPSRAVHFIYCNGVTLENIYINTRYDVESGENFHVTNCDGLTFSSSKNAFLFNSVITSQDDNISIKSGRNEEGRRIGKSTESIRIFDCKFLGGLGVAVGSEMSGCIRDVIVNNCQYENTAFVAQLKAPWGRGGAIENITYKNIIFNDTVFSDKKWARGGICIDQYYGVETPDFSLTYPIDDNMPIIRDVWFENIRLSKRYGMAIYLCGRPEMFLKNINFKNIHAEAQYGLFGSYVDQVKLDNVTVVVQSGEPYNWENVKGLKQNKEQ